jgi:hypothetical protein
MNSITGQNVYFEVVEFYGTSECKLEEAEEFPHYQNMYRKFHYQSECNI